MNSLNNLVKTVKFSGKPFVFVRPGIVASFYLADPLQKACPRIAAALDVYLSFIGRTGLQSYVADNGDSKSLTDKRLARDMSILRNLPSSADEFNLEYSSEPGAGVGRFGVTVIAQEPDEDFPKQAKLVRFEFPETALSDYGEASLIGVLTALANQLRPQSGNAGFGFKRGSGFEDESIEAVNRLLPRYLAFDPCYNDIADDMLGHTLTAHWINFLDQDMFARCGAMLALRETAPQVLAQSFEYGVMLRSSRVPPVGDRNLRAADLGSIPDLARFLKPTRIPLSGMGDDEFAVESWLERFDELGASPWDN